jgi:2-succinyl-6-hydroxy-2,4-cyclohexadiene-1-carboxylate synthase
MPILALHGFTGCGADFAPIAELSSGEWICPDLPGHGTGAPLDCSPQATVDFIDEKCPQLSSRSRRIDKKSDTPNILLGYSMGARAALLHATQNPEHWDALILISPNPGIEDAKERVLRREADSILAERIEHEGVEAFLDYWQKTPLIYSQQTVPAAIREAMHANRRQHRAEGLANSLRQFGQGSFPDLWPELEKLQLPIILITGNADKKYTDMAQRMCAQLPKAIHQKINDCGHAPHLEDTEKCSQVLYNFLNTLSIT